ncbi:MAG: hypothetical protein OXQ29_27460 [Rhodospirillaceae bacterium]|nr:hypothetical protein [Rhodospirillaceae bacterium]
MAEHEEGVSLFGMRLLCSEVGAKIGFPRSIPGLVRNVVSNGQAVLAGLPLSLDPWIVGPADVEQLVDLLSDLRRHVDTVVFSLPDGSSNPEHAIVSPQLVAVRAIGTVQVVVLTGDASFELSDRVGREFSVFRQAVRTYRPGFDPDKDDPYVHPLALPQVVAEWKERHGIAFESFLIQQAIRRSVSGADLDQRVPPFKQIRQLANLVRRDKERRDASTDKELLELAMEEIEELKTGIQRDSDESQDLLEMAESEKNEAEQEVNQLRALVSHLRGRVQYLESRARQVAGDADGPDIPDSLDPLKDWAEKFLAGDIVLHNRALRGAKRSEYEDQTLIYRSLLLLRDHYVPMRRSVLDASRASFEQACIALGVTESGSITEARAGEQGDTYVVNFGGQNRTLDRHLKKGDARDKRYCFRLYFFWDDDTEQAVVGWLPSHLETRAT